MSVKPISLPHSKEKTAAQIFKSELQDPAQKAQYSVMNKPLKWNDFFYQERARGKRKITSRCQLVVQTGNQMEILKTFEISKKYLNYSLSGINQEGKKSHYGEKNLPDFITVKRTPDAEIQKTVKKREEEPVCFSQRGEERKVLAAYRYHKRMKALEDSKKKDHSPKGEEPLASSFKQLLLEEPLSPASRGEGEPSFFQLERFDSGSEADLDDQLDFIQKKGRNNQIISYKKCTDPDFD